MAGERRTDPSTGSPYRPGMGLDPPYLGDREEQIQRFRDFIEEPEAGHNLLVTGLRGVGKTVLLKHYTDAAESAGWIVADREWNQNDGEPPIFRQLLLEDLARLAMKLSATERVKSAAQRLARSLRDVISGVRVRYEGVEVGYEPREGTPVPRRLDDELRDAMDEVGRLCQKTDRNGVIIRYDEFHVVAEKRGATTISALLSATAAVQQMGLPVMLVLCGLPPMIEHLVHAKSYSERMFTPERLANLRLDEARTALVDPARILGRYFEDSVIEAVMDDTQGYPYFIQLYGDRLWKGSKERTITLDEFHQLRPAILRDLDDLFFEARYQRATPRERAVLHAIAALGGESATVKQLMDKANLKNNEVQPLVGYLVDKGLLYRPSRGVVAFTAPMFGAYLRRTEPH
jgi:AAA ATPase domain